VQSRILPAPQEALDYALSHSTAEDAIFITGSLYLVGQLRQCWKSRVQVPDCD
jgi:folylpolyglutamate synthase/dihydropteroate synthase